MPSESDQASVYLAGAQVGRDNAQPIWKKEVRDTELISEYKQFQEKKSKKHRELKKCKAGGSHK